MRKKNKKAHLHDQRGRRPYCTGAMHQEPPATRIFNPMVGYCQDPARLMAQQPLGAALKL